MIGPGGYAELEMDDPILDGAPPGPSSGPPAWALQNGALCHSWRRIHASGPLPIICCEGMLKQVELSVCDARPTFQTTAACRLTCMSQHSRTAAASHAARP